MSIVTIPEGMWAGRQDFGMKYHDMHFSNEDSGASQVVRHGPPRLTCTLAYEEQIDDDQAAMWTSLIFSLEGRVNLLAVYNVLRSVPRGTMRGTPTLSAPAAAGADTMTLATGQPGCTLRRGDWIGVHQGANNRQIVHVQQDATADGSGVMTVTFRHRLRTAVPSGAAVVWDRPTCLMRQVSDSSSWSARGAVESGFSIELIEDWLA